MFPLEPCSFPSAQHPPFLSCPLPGAHPGRAVTCPIPLSLCVAGPCGTTRLIPDRASLAWCASCKEGPYSLHKGPWGVTIGNPTCRYLPPPVRGIRTQPSPIIPQQGCTPGTGQHQAFLLAYKKNKQQLERKMRILHPWLPSLPSVLSPLPGQAQPDAAQGRPVSACAAPRVGSLLRANRHSLHRRAQKPV